MFELIWLFLFVVLKIDVFLKSKDKVESTACCMLHLKSALLTFLRTLLFIYYTE